MSAAVAIPRIPTTEPRLTPTALPSQAQLALEQTSMRGLEKVFQRGVQPDLDDLVGWEFRGVNHMPLNNYVRFADLVGIKKFVKGFFRTEDGRVMGYNSPVARNALDGRWNVAPKKFGYYEVAPVDPTARDNYYLHAVLLNYGKGGNPVYDPSQVLRDYVVQVDAKNPDLFLGKAYGAFGPLRIPTNFFILERFRVGLTDYVKR
ncbi:MAG TPA: hypothetical protein VIV11_26670 [Kofleriaceae bacterium]